MLITPSLGFPTGRSFTSSTPRHQQVFWHRCRGIEEEEAPTSTTFSHVNYAPAKRQASFLAPLPGRKKKTSAREVLHAHPLLRRVLFLAAHGKHQAHGKVIDFISYRRPCPNRFPHFFFPALPLSLPTICHHCRLSLPTSNQQNV
jgi:hypothetical protein